MENLDRAWKFREMIYNKLYRNDGLLIFHSYKSLRKIEIWLEDFQASVNKLLDSKKLKFSIYKTERNDES